MNKKKQHADEAAAKINDLMEYQTQDLERHLVARKLTALEHRKIEALVESQAREMRCYLEHAIEMMERPVKSNEVIAVSFAHTPVKVAVMPRWAAYGLGFAVHDLPKP